MVKKKVSFCEQLQLQLHYFLCHSNNFEIGFRDRVSNKRYLIVSLIGCEVKQSRVSEVTNARLLCKTIEDATVVDSQKKKSILKLVSCVERITIEKRKTLPQFAFYNRRNPMKFFFSCLVRNLCSISWHSQIQRMVRKKKKLTKRRWAAWMAKISDTTAETGRRWSEDIKAGADFLHIRTFFSFFTFSSFEWKWKCCAVVKGRTEYLGQNSLLISFELDRLPRHKNSKKIQQKKNCNVELPLIVSSTFGASLLAT